LFAALTMSAQSCVELSLQRQVSRNPRDARLFGSADRPARRSALSTTLHVDAAAQLALAKRVDSLAYNLANSSAPGFLREGLKFDSVLSTTAGRNIAFPAANGDYISLVRGAVHRTANSLDVAVRGDGWLAIDTPRGIAYTRDGRLQVDPSGRVSTVTGHPVLDDGGSPLQVDPNGGGLAIATDGTVSQRGKTMGILGLFGLDPAARLSRNDSASLIPDREAFPIRDFGQVGVVQGSLEQSNVDPVVELTRLIQIQRAFDHVSACMSLSDSTQQEAIRALGGQT